MKIREIINEETMPRARPLCPKCGGKLIRGKDMQAQKRVLVCPKCRNVLDEHATVVHAQGGITVLPDTDPRKRLHVVLKHMKRGGQSRDERLRQVKSYKFIKSLDKDEEDEQMPKLKSKSNFPQDHIRYREQGREAFRLGKQQKDNPHKTWAARANWASGWDEEAAKGAK